MIRACASCGQKNRIPASRLAEEGRCGACKAVLSALDAPLEVSAEEFDEIVQGARVPVLVDFWAAWCGPCRMAAPEVTKVAQAARGRALVLKVDTDANPSLAARYQVSGIPNFLVLKGGRPVLQQAGVVPAQQMLQWLQRAS